MNKKISSFLISTGLISGIGWGTLYFLANAGRLEFGQPLFMILFLVAGFGPTFGTFIAIAISEGKSGFKAYWHRLFRFKLSIGYYLLSFLFLLFLGFVPALVDGSLGEKFNAIKQISWAMVPVYFLSSFFLGGLEELGWRGYLQHELQKKLNIWIVLLIVWIIWAVWHYPLFHIPGVSQFGQNFWIFSIYALFFTLIFGWLYGRTLSIPLAVLCHTLVNTMAAVGFLNFLAQDTVNWAAILIILFVLVGIHFLFPVEKISQD